MPSPRLDVNALGAYIRDQRMSAEVSLRQLAAASGVSNPYLSQVERGLRNPSAEILGQIARALQISAETLYVQAGLLDERMETTMISVAEAIAADTALTDRQRTVLMEIYSAFQAENAAGDGDASGQEAATRSTKTTSTPTRKPNRARAATH